MSDGGQFDATTAAPLSLLRKKNKPDQPRPLGEKKKEIAKIQITTVTPLGTANGKKRSISRGGSTNTSFEDSASLTSTMGEESCADEMSQTDIQLKQLQQQVTEAVFTLVQAVGTKNAITRATPEIDEVSHQRRYMAQQEKAQNKECIIGQIKLLKSLKIRRQIRLKIEQRITQALTQSKLYLNVCAFVILEGRDFLRWSLDPDNNNHPPYEQIKNDHKPIVVTAEDLFLDMILFEPVYKEMLQVCLYLSERASPLSHFIYKRPIEYVDTKPLDESTSLLDKWFGKRRQGFYYAVMVNFGLSKPCETFKETDLLREVFVDIKS